MYTEFYGLFSEPFHVTPDPSRLFMSEKHKDAIGAVLYGIMAGKGFVAITGDVGVGKTTVLRYCLERLSETAGQADKIEIVYILQPALTPRELFMLLHRELVGYAGVELQKLGSAEIVQALQRHLLDAYDHGRSVVVVVDEAQNMPIETLESFRTLSNLETNSSKLLQIVLVGQTELDTLLARHELRQLDQRIAVRAYIPPMTAKEARQYIAHRLAASSRQTAARPFTRRAINFILSEARGNPRRINMMCDNALMNGFGHRARRVTRGIARQAIRQLDNRARLRSRSAYRNAAWVAGLLAPLILVAGAAFDLPDVRAAIGHGHDVLNAETRADRDELRPIPSATALEAAPAIAVPAPGALSGAAGTATTVAAMSSAPALVASPRAGIPEPEGQTIAPPSVPRIHATPASALVGPTPHDLAKPGPKPVGRRSAAAGSAAARSPCDTGAARDGGLPGADGAAGSRCADTRSAQMLPMRIARPRPTPTFDPIGRPVRATIDDHDTPDHAPLPEPSLSADHRP